MLAAMCAAIASPATAGPISKFDSKPPVADYPSAAKLEDIERCLIDIGDHGEAMVYRQPDRPDDVTVVWLLVGAGQVAGRIDLHRLPAGTRVRSWNPLRQAAACAPR